MERQQHKPEADRHAARYQSKCNRKPAVPSRSWSRESLMNAMLALTLEPLDPVPIRGFNGPEDMQLTPDGKHIVVSELRRACLWVGRESDVAALRLP
jgi:hypothetical protein